MCLNADLLAHFQYGTSGTMWKIACANMLSKWDKQTIDVDPIALGKFRFQLDHALLGCGCFDIAPAIGHAMDVNVHANEWLATGNSHDEMRALGTNTRKRTQGFFITRKFAVEFINDALCQVVNLNSLAFVEC